ncbi:MAG: DNA gyrase inhibitor YacG, partial [Nitrosomonadales bacterium]|nr:DNA gyrase inhibitor YacG [Nitrosomonadales bacterium]
MKKNCPTCSKLFDYVQNEPNNPFCSER